MAAFSVFPPINQPVTMHSVRVRLPTLPVIEHPMLRIADRTKMKVTGSASLHLRRSKTMPESPILRTASSVCWSDFDFAGKPRKKKYKKRAMVTKSKSDEQLLEVLTERLVHGFDGMKGQFKTSDPPGQDGVTKDALLHIMYKAVGHIDTDKFDRMLQNLGLDSKEIITFDTFVSRFKEFKDVQRQWTNPVQREVGEERMTKAHPEEHLRDGGVHEWGELSVAPKATYDLSKALRERKVDFRAILPDECFVSDGKVTKIQLRTALQEIGVNLTDLEYKRFWERYDKKNEGYVPLQRLYTLMNTDSEGEPLSVPPRIRTPVFLKPYVGPTKPAPARSAAVAAREFALGRHKPRGDTQVLESGIRVAGISSPEGTSLRQQAGSRSDDGEGDLEGKVSPAAEAAARSKIRAVVNRKSQSKFDSIMDCLNYKLEERYDNMTMAFKIFDIHDDGSVMRVDFRRVLSEYGFPLTALQLGNFMHRVGMTVKHGMISYRQLLSKLMNRQDAFVSQILDDYIQAVQEGQSTGSGASDTQEEGVARKLVEYLHQPYVKLAADLLRAEKGNKGVLDVEEIRKVVEHLFGHAMTEKQWEDLQTQLPFDADGNVRYIDFLSSFNKREPGAWNLVDHGSLKLPRNQVIHTPTQEVQHLERTKTEGYTKADKKPKNRSLQQLREELKQFFTDHLHDVDARFKDLDRKSHKRFSKWQFGTLTKLCGFPMTDKELNDVWLSLKLSDDNMSTFNGVVMEFAPNFTPFKGKERRPSGEEKDDGGEGEPAEGGEMEDGKILGENRLCSAGEQRDMTERGPDPDFPMVPRLQPSQYLANIMSRVQPAVRKNWEYLRQGFRNHDPHGFGSVQYKQMQRLVDQLKSGLTVEERDQLCSQFDFKRIGRCNYLAFMKAFTEGPTPCPKLVYKPHTHKLDKKPKDIAKPITVSDALLRIRQKLLKHWKNLRRGFQKNDSSRTGQMSMADFKRVLAECSVPVSEEDVYFIFCEFDANMDGFISYQEFLDALLRVG